MNSGTLYALEAIIVLGLVTFFLRAVPFILLGKRELSDSMRYLGDALPPAIMIILLIYCLRGTDFSAFPFGLAELISLAAAAAVHLWKKNMYISIIVGTVLYMTLIRTVFAV